MKIKKMILKNFRAYENATVEFGNNMNCIVGKNDVGKSTIFAALDWFFNDNVQLKAEDFNVDGYDCFEDSHCYDDGNGNFYVEKNKCVNEETTSLSVSVCFCDVHVDNDYNHIWGELLDDEGNIWITKSEDYPIEPYSYLEDEYENIANSFPCLTKGQTRKNAVFARHCNYSIQTTIFTSVGKLLNDCSTDELKVEYRKIGRNPDALVWEKMSYHLSSVKVRSEVYNYYKENDADTKKSTKNIDEKFKIDYLSFLTFPKFELYSSDVSLESLLSKNFSNEITQSIKRCKNSIAERIQQVVANENIHFHNKDIYIDAFANDYLEFEKKALTMPTMVNVPIQHRGDGFKLQVKNAIFRMLAEKQYDKSTPIFFAFEEPETHLHPSAQIEMYETLKKLSENQNYQVVFTTHSPTIVSQCKPDDIIQVVKDENGMVKVRQHREDIINDVIKDLGITPNSKLVSELGFKDCYVFVEGKYDVDFFKHLFKLYGKNDDNIGYIPMGSGDNVGLWVNKNLVEALNKPYIFVIDSDNKDKVQKYNLPSNNIHVLNKREIENYITPDSLEKIDYLSSKTNCLQKYKAQWDNLDIPLVLFVEKNDINMSNKIEFSAEDVKNCANNDAIYMANFRKQVKSSQQVTTDAVKNRADKLKEKLNIYYFEYGNATLTDLDFKYIDEKGNTQDEFLVIAEKIKNLCN